MVVIAFFYIFPMIAFVGGQAEQAFFQDWIFAVPERHRKTDLLVPIAKAGDPVFIPAVRTRTAWSCGRYSQVVPYSL
jgi:hypothetical protein